jgi:hypothetical protein
LRGEELARGRQTIAAEPAEQLLRTVRNQQKARRDADQRIAEGREASDEVRKDVMLLIGEFLGSGCPLGPFRRGVVDPKIVVFQGAIIWLENTLLLLN